MGEAFFSGRGMLVAKEREEPFSNYMGRGGGIANPPIGIRLPGTWEHGGRKSSAPFRKQRVGCGAVGCGLIPMRGHAGNFGFEQGNPLPQFRLRIGRKILSREPTRCIAFGPWAIWFFHCRAASQAKRLAVNRRDGYSRANRG
jgi:hypothetical protein